MFVVRVADNFHYMNEEETYTHSEHPTWAEAVAAACRIVDASLAEHCQPGISAADLHRSYTMFGDDPYIVSPPTGEQFSAWEYAKQRCEVLCATEVCQDAKPNPAVVAKDSGEGRGGP